MNEERNVHSRRVGLKDIYVALVTKNDATGYTAGTPTKLARAISAKVSDKYSSEKLYSDDAVEETATNYEGTEIELDVNALTPAEKATLFGHLYEKGFLVKGEDDKPNEIAIGYRVKRLNNKYEFVWYFCGTASEGMEETNETKADKVSTQTDTVKLSCYARKHDGKFSCSVDESNLIAEDTDAASAIENRFSKVQEWPTSTAAVGG